MKNKLIISKLLIGTLFSAILSGLPMMSLAANLTYSADTTVSLTGSNLNFTIVSGSVASSLTVNTTSLAVTIPASGTFTLKSATRLFSISGASHDANYTQECLSGNVGQLVFTSPSSGSETITISPESPGCSS